jgi:nucleotide-binding universal stress UspA family protein
LREIIEKRAACRRKSAMMQKKILVPVGSSGKDLNSVHCALALAERLRAQVYILQHDAVDASPNSIATWLDEALLDLINSARQAGLTVSHHIAHRELKEEIVGMVKDESIDVLVFGADNGVCEHLMLQIKDLVPSQIIQVREKDHINYL